MQMNPQDQLCPHCGASGKAGKIGIHSQKTQRYCCKTCQRTFSATFGSAYYQLKKPVLFTLVTTLLAYGCPLQAIVMAYGLSENTVRDWLKRSGRHCQQVHDRTVRTRAMGFAASSG
jgi:transposase-like protein